MKYIFLVVAILSLVGCSIGTQLTSKIELSGYVIDGTYFDADNGETYWIDAYLRHRFSGIEYATITAIIGKDTISGTDGVLYDIEVVYP